MPQLTIETLRGKEVAIHLHDQFYGNGLHSNTEMPEDILPAGVAKGSSDHCFFITLIVSIDYQRDANALWAAGRRTYEDPATRWLFNPAELVDRPSDQAVKDMQKHGLSKKQLKDAWIWRTIALTFLKKWDGAPRKFLADCGWDAPTVLQRLKTDYHDQNGRPVKDYPYLSGNKIGPLWLRMLRDNVGETRLKALDKVPIPVDVHVARATFALGLVRGKYSGNLDVAFNAVREAWFKAVEGCDLAERPMMALDMDEPLWHLSKYGCTMRNQTTGACPMYETCEVKEHCVSGRVVVNGRAVELDT